MISRVLVTSIYSWNKKSGSDTFSTLLEDYGADNVANIYVRSGLPDSQSCKHYFRIIEQNVVRSVWNKKIITGSEVHVDSANHQIAEGHIEAEERKIYCFFTKYRLRIFSWIRELLWRLGRWNSKELNQFISDFDPEVFIFPIESYMHFNILNNYIIDTYNPKKVIGFLWDDNFTYKQRPYNIWARIERYFVRKSVARLVSKCDDILAICPKMKEECDREFNIDSIVLTKPAKEQQVAAYKYHNQRPMRLVYTGALVIGRFEAIHGLVETIVKINKQHGQCFYLDIYSQTSLRTSQIRLLNTVNSSCFRGSIPQSEVAKVQQDADILVFVENINNRFENMARLSFSTKVTDYLSAGRTILAIGPTDIASIEYFEAEDCAIICNDKASIYSELIRILDRPDILMKYSHITREVADKNHKKTNIQKKFWDVINTRN